MLQRTDIATDLLNDQALVKHFILEPKLLANEYRNTIVFKSVENSNVNSYISDSTRDHIIHDTRLIVGLVIFIHSL